MWLDRIILIVLIFLLALRAFGVDAENGKGGK